MIISQIVAVSENGVIGKDNALPWQMPDDQAYFRKTTWGHHIVTGRRNYEAEGRALPGRVNLVLSRNSQLQLPDAVVVHHLEEAVDIAKKAGESELFIVGGEEIYNLAMDITDRIYLTRIHARFEGDTFYPEPDMKVWKEVSRIPMKRDEKNPYDYDYLVYERK